ncbi:MAG: BlaI/MecI/CopY family transcriptional regulator [Caulobacteraceae bacterium]
MKITASESLIMEVLWRAGRPLAVEDIREALTDETWTDATIRTFLSRLVKKRAVATFKESRRFLFRPLIARADYVHAESKSLIDRLFDGQIEPFVAHFSERQDLSAEEIARLRQLIERLGRGE